MIYDWKSAVNKTGQILGCESICIREPNCSLTPDLLLDALQVIHQSIDSGVPAIVWNLVSFEFGLIYGYDDDKCQFMYSSVCQTALAVAYSLLGRTTDNPELFVAALRKNTASKTMTPSAIALALETLLLHSKGEEKGVEGYTQGLEAYDKWINLFRDRHKLNGDRKEVFLIRIGREQRKKCNESIIQCTFIRLSVFGATIQPCPTMNFNLIAFGSLNWADSRGLIKI